MLHQMSMTIYENIKNGRPIVNPIDTLTEETSAVRLIDKESKEEVSRAVTSKLNQIDEASYEGV